MPKVTCLYEDGSVEVPGWLTDLASFRRWADSDAFPEKLHASYLKGEVWVDLSREQVFWHNQLKGEITSVVLGLVTAERKGRCFSHGAFLTNVMADFSTQPDGTFVSREGLEDGRVRFVPGQQGGYVELEGVPDMVLEVLSDSSVRKDTIDLRAAYWEAGIQEYWLVDARRGALEFDILRRTARGYTATRRQDGWVKSVVFGKSFRLMRVMDDFGQEDFTLEVR